MWFIYCDEFIGNDSQATVSCLVLCFNTGLKRNYAARSCKIEGLFTANRRKYTPPIRVQ